MKLGVKERGKETERERKRERGIKIKREIGRQKKREREKLEGMKEKTFEGGGEKNECGREGQLGSEYSLFKRGRGSKSFMLLMFSKNL